VRDTLHQPDGVTPTRHGEQHVWKHIPRGWLRVTSVEADQTTIVIIRLVRAKSNHTTLGQWRLSEAWSD
jgi:hypothetical protein